MLGDRQQASFAENFVGRGPSLVEKAISSKITEQKESLEEDRAEIASKVNSTTNVAADGSRVKNNYLTRMGRIVRGMRSYTSCRVTL